MASRFIQNPFFILSFLILLIANNLAASGDIKWYAYEEGMALGKDENKKVFLYFWTEWCPNCKKMEKKTFQDASVIAYLNKNFISIRVNSDKQRDIAAIYGVRGVPDNWFIAENNEAITNQPGYIPAKMFLPLLKFIRTNNYKEMTFSQFLKKM